MAARRSMPAGLLPVLVLFIFVVMMDGRVMTAMLPEISHDLHASVSATSFAITSYLLAYGLCQLVYGPIADRVGAMRVMATASGLFVVVAALGALAPTVASLTAIRLLTGAVAAASSR